MYRTYSSSTSTNVDEKMVTDPTPYTKNGYTIIRYEYNYNINTPERYLADTRWTNSKTSPSGYEYANEKKVTRTTKYENLGKWVTSKGALGDYTYNISTKKQYKYKYNNPKATLSTVWTESKTPPAGYTYANEKVTTRTAKYENLNKWVTSQAALGEYTYKIGTKKQYKYKYNNPIKVKVAEIWTTSITPPTGYTYTGESKTNKTESYVDLGKWVSSKSELGEYTYDVQTRTLYKYKTKKTTTITESKWFYKNPGGDWVFANQTRKVKVY